MVESEDDTVFEPRLPGSPGDLIRVAISDLEKVEQDSRFKVDMDNWFYVPFDESEPCHVCLAGAVMAVTFCVDPANISLGSKKTPSYAFGSDHIEVFENPDHFRLLSLNDLRNGKVEHFYQYFYDIYLLQDLCPFIGNDRPVPYKTYEDDPAQFKAWALAVADEIDLKEQELSENGI